VIGYEVSEVLNVKPAEYFVEVIKRRSVPAARAKSRVYLLLLCPCGSSRRAWSLIA
jgi:hypothetical protein